MGKWNTQQKQNDLNGTNILTETTRDAKNGSVVLNEVWSKLEMTPKEAMMLQNGAEMG